jgi:glycosyltransferase involved in cell wall biosynthesis
MKILSVIKTLELSHGGPPEVLRNQLEEINSINKKISILKFDSISCFYLFKCFLFKTYRIKIYNFLKKFDIIHFHEIWSIKLILIVFFANKLLIKHFCVGHGYLDTWSINQKYFKKKIFIKFFLQKVYNSAAASFFSSKSEYLEAQKSIKVYNPFIIPNGVSLNKFKERKLKFKKHKKILFFGRIHEKKGLELLIETIKELPKEFFEEFFFEITGPGTKRDVNNLELLINKKNLRKRVKYNLPIKNIDKIEYLQNFDVFILPSFEEGDSIALKEALASYLPAIISSQCRLDIVKEYNAGDIVMTNKKSLYEGFIRLQSWDIIKMGNQARKLIVKQFDNKNCSQRLNDIYSDIFNAHKTSKDWIKQ